MKPNLALLALAVSAAWTQIPPFTNPVSCLLFHAPSRSLRLLIGIPGAAYLGPAIGAAVDQGYPSPDGRFAITTADAATTLLQIAASDSPLATLEGLLPHADQAAWSSDSKGTVLFSSSTSQMQHIRLAGGQWTASDPIAVSGLPDGATLFAAMSSCRCAVFGSVDGSARHFVVLGPDGEARPLPDVDASLVATVDEDDRLYLASASQVQRVRLSDLAPLPETVVQDSALAQPAALAASRADNVIVVATQDQRVLLYDLQSGAPAGVVTLAMSPKILRRLASPGRYYQLNDPKAGIDPLYVLALGQVNRVFFVPALEP
jgi:hypothetical protein